MIKLAAGWQERLTLVTIEQEEPLFLNGYKIPEDLELPIFTEFLNNLKGTQIPWLDFVNGTLYLLANSPEHPRKDEYRQLLLAYDPDIVENLLRQSAMMAREGNFYPAIELLQALIAIAPDLPEAYFNLGLSLQDLAKNLSEKGDYERVDLYLTGAKHAFEQTLRLRGDFPYADYFLGFLYSYTGETDKARFAWERCLVSGIEDDLLSEVKEQLQKMQDKA